MGLRGWGMSWPKSIGLCGWAIENARLANSMTARCTVTTANDPVPAAQTKSQVQLVDLAGKKGTPIAPRIVAFTSPSLHIEPKLEYEQRSGTKGPEFRFQKGTLKLTLRH